MNVVIPFHNGDANLAIDLVKWIGQLGGIGDGSLFLICDSGTKPEHIESVKEASFPLKGIVNSNWPAVSGWPQGSNSLFRMALSVVEGSARKSWLWLEPDAIPLKRGWMDAIRKEYESLPTRVGMVRGTWETDTSAKSSPHPSGDHPRYMGNVYVCNNPRLPNRLMSGIGVYPADALKEMIYFTKTSQAWDVEAARFLVSQCHNTKLIHHFWGIMGMAPTFAEKRTDTSPPNTFTLDSIHKDAVIFHRNKDGTLLNLLKSKLETVIEVPKFDPVPVGPTHAQIIDQIRKSVDNW